MGAGGGMMCSSLRAAMSQSTPSPLRGGIKGGGRLAQISGLSHPLPTSPVEGEVLPCGWGTSCP